MITYRASWAAGAAMALTLGAFALAGPAAASAKASTVNTVIATIPLPDSAEPEFTVVDPVRGVVWTANPYNAYEISEHTNTVIRTIALTHYPDAMTVDPRPATCFWPALTALCRSSIRGPARSATRPE